jgi:hypothetical protein
MKTIKYLYKLHYLILNYLQTNKTFTLNLLELNSKCSIDVILYKLLQLENQKLNLNDIVYEGNVLQPIYDNIDSSIFNIKQLTKLNKISNLLNDSDFIKNLNYEVITFKNSGAELTQNGFFKKVSNEHKDYFVDFAKMFNLQCNYWWHLSDNVNITIEFVINNINENWNWINLSVNPNIKNNLINYKQPIELQINNKISVFIKFVDIFFKYYGSNKLQTFMYDNYLQELIDNNIDLNFFDIISKNYNISQEFITKHINQCWNWNYLSGNKNLTPEFITKYIDKNWDWQMLSMNPNLTTEFVNTHKFNLEMSLVCKYNQNINFNVKEHLQSLSFNLGSRFEEFIYYLTKNKYITIDFIIKTGRHNWNYYELHKYHKIPVDFIETNINENWNWIQLSNVVYNNQYIYKNLILSMLNKI